MPREGWRIRDMKILRDICDLWSWLISLWCVCLCSLVQLLWCHGNEVVVVLEWHWLCCQGCHVDVWGIWEIRWWWKKWWKCRCLASLSVEGGLYCWGGSSFRFRGIVPVSKSVYASAAGLVLGILFSSSPLYFKELVCSRFCDNQTLSS